MQIKKTLSSVLIFCFMMVIVLPAYSAKLVEEETIKKPEPAKELRSTTEQRSSVKLIGEEETIKKPEPAEGLHSTTEQRSDNNKQQVTQEPLKSENKKVPQASAESGSSFWWWVLGILAVLVVIAIVKSAINSGDEEILEARRQQREKEREERQKYLIDKYGYEIGSKLFKEEVWVGMTEDQLTDSIGYPDDIKDGDPQKTYFYNGSVGPRGGTQYGLTVTIKNGQVTRWHE